MERHFACGAIGNTDGIQGLTEYDGNASAVTRSRAPFTPTQQPIAPNRIDSDEWRWRPLTEQPANDTYALALLDDETVQSARWTGTEWKTADCRRPLYWRPNRDHSFTAGKSSPPLAHMSGIT